MADMKVDQCEGVNLLEPKSDKGWSKNPFQKEWSRVPTRHVFWDHNLSMIRVCSTVENINGRGIELHLSISCQGVYPPEWVEKKVREDFGAQDFEKDDHGSSVMHLWLPIEKDKRGDCPCKEEEK